MLAAQRGQRSGWSWQGFSVLLRDTLADWVLAAVILELLLNWSETPSLTDDGNLKDYAAYLYFLGFS